MTTASLELIIQDILRERPGLKHLYTDTSIIEYLHPALTWKQQKNIFPYADLLQQKITASVEKLYGDELANQAEEQLKNSWVIETGAHLHIPRRFNRAAPTQEPQINSLLFQGQVIWAYANQKVGNNLAISLNSGRVPLDNTNSGAYLDLPALKAPLTLASKKKHPDSPQSLIPARTKEEIQPKMDLLEMYKKQRILPETQYMMGQKVLNNFLEIQSSFSDQIATSHALLINQVAPVTQITLDSELISTEFLLALLKDPSSLTFSIFNDPQKKADFLEVLDGIRTGWTKDSSPFYTVHHTGKGFRLLKYTGDLSPDKLIKGLEEKTLWPTGVMKFFTFMVEAGILPIGGWTQAGYCTEIRNKSEILLRKFGYEERANCLKNMPTHIVAVGPCWKTVDSNGHTKLLDPITAILDPLSVDLSHITDLTGKQTLLLAAPTLYEYILKKPSPINYDELTKML